VFECRDEPLVIAAGTDSLWSELCDALGRGELVDDSRFESLDARVSNREELRSTLGETLSKRSRSEWLDVLHDHGVPAGPIYDTKSVWGDDHVQWRQLHKTMDREDREDADVIDHPVHFSNLVTELATVPETLGESTEDVLREYGYSTEDIRELRRAGVID
jgi:crotonobetainyl-CoA:carnitine CoA-transferase CaiB-like acyl-CoA transferase